MRTAPTSDVLPPLLPATWARTRAVQPAVSRSSRMGSECSGSSRRSRPVGADRAKIAVMHVVMPMVRAQ